MYFTPSSSSNVCGGSSRTDAGLEREHLAQVRVADERDVVEVVPDGEALARLLGREDVLELFEAQRRAVAQVDARVGDAMLVGQRLEPLHVLARQHAGVRVERVAGGLVVVRVVHATGDRCVVVAEDGDLGNAAHDVAALVGTCAVTHYVTKTVEVIDALVTQAFHHSREGLDVGVNVAEDSEPHSLVRFPF